jgi:hypothetical protein
MNKTILHPGNGLDFPKKGEYVKVKLLIYDKDKNILFNSNYTKDKMIDIRFGCRESNILLELEELVGEMSLFERCSMEIDESLNHSGISETVLDLLKYHRKIIFEVEIIDISLFPHS